MDCKRERAANYRLGRQLWETTRKTCNIRVSILRGIIWIDRDSFIEDWSCSRRCQCERGVDCIESGVTSCRVDDACSMSCDLTADLGAACTASDRAHLIFRSRNWTDSKTLLMLKMKSKTTLILVFIENDRR